jgi:hypothetical protein
MTADRPIPLTRSEFLQDATIELGRRFAPGHPFRSFDVEVDSCEHEGEVLERLTVLATTFYGTSSNLTLWDDRTMWVDVTLCASENNSEYSVGFYPRCQGFTSARIAEAFRDTVSLSTRLCYAESPLPTLRQVWNHEGEVETSGQLGKDGNAQPGTGGNR